jgi:hypothetical protein
VQRARAQCSREKKRGITLANPAAYATLQDDPIVLEIGGDIDHTFAFDAPDVDVGRKSVLSFVADPVIGDGENVSVEFDLNGTNILTHLFDTAPARAIRRSWARIS